MDDTLEHIKLLQKWGHKELLAYAQGITAGLNRAASILDGNINKSKE